MNLTIVTMRLFDRPRTGGELCTARLLHALQSAGHTLTVLGLGHGPQHPPATCRYVSVGEWLPAFADMPATRRATMLLDALRMGRAASVQRLHEPGSARRIRQHLRQPGEPIDAIVVDHLQSLDWLRPLLRRPAHLPPMLLVSHNLESAGYVDRAAAVAGRGWRAGAQRWMLRREARLLARLEALAMQHASVIACLTEADARSTLDAARHHGRQPPVEVLPGFALPREMPWDSGAPHGLAPAEVQARLAALRPASRCVGLLGTWTWEPNRAGLMWLLDKVLPQLPQECRLVLAGTGLGSLPSHPRITVLGRIEAVDSFYDGVDLVAIPSLYGSGIHEKAIEAIGRGLPVVATPHALRGMSHALPAHVHLAADADAFAAACASVAVTRDTQAGQGWNRQRRHAYAQVLARSLVQLTRGGTASDTRHDHASPATSPAAAWMPARQ